MSRNEPRIQPQVESVWRSVLQFQFVGFWSLWPPIGELSQPPKASSEAGMQHQLYGAVNMMFTDRLTADRADRTNQLRGS
jgi:hypothetical protein